MNLHLRTPQLRKILETAVSKGYKYDSDTGVILSWTGIRLKLTKTGSQRYPTVAISVPGIGKGTFAVPAHRFAGWCIWGEAIFEPGVEVRHQNGVWDIRKCSLRLGTRIENMSDISPTVRSRAAAAGRASQAQKPVNAKIADDVIRFIRKTAQRDVRGFLLQNELDRLHSLTGVKKQLISGILRGVAYTSVR